MIGQARFRHRAASPRYEAEYGNQPCHNTVIPLIEYTQSQLRRVAVSTDPASSLVRSLLVPERPPSRRAPSWRLLEHHGAPTRRATL